MKEYVIHDSSGTRAVILPEKGATVVSIQRNGVEFLYRMMITWILRNGPAVGYPFFFLFLGD